MSTQILATAFGDHVFYVRDTNYNTHQAANVTEGSVNHTLDLATIGSGFSLCCVSEPENWEMLLTNEAVQ